MGSSGTGRLSDYPGSAPGNSSSKTGGSSNQDKCGKAFTTSLEEVERSDYFKSNARLPKTGTKIEIVFAKPRLAAVTDGIIIGYLPTERNYVKPCIDSGYKFPGVVNASNTKPIQSLQVTVSPFK